MALVIDIDDSDFQKTLDALSKQLDSIGRGALMDMADALLALARLEVPHDTGRLQLTGNAYWDVDSSAVAFDTDYASYVHEGIRADGSHRILNYQKGRKKKFLEDPLKMNLSKWLDVAQLTLNNALS